MSEVVEPLSRSRYQVITTLGQGGMARVLLTMSRGPAGVTKLLVVKELKEELKGDPEFVTMFLDEARIAARLNHPNVIQTYEVSSDGDHPIIVMEYLEGQSLSAVIGRVGRKSLPLDLHLYILSQVAAGLHYAHDLRSFDGEPLGLVHRDVSPHNVFVTYDGRVLLVDFGIAKAADSAGFTRTGVFKGKIGYAAAEQLSGAKIDRRADIFALGVMLWEALAQKRLTFGELEAVVMKRRIDGTDLPIREIAPDAPPELLAICEKAMAHKADDRYATAAEMRQAIEGYLESSRRVGAEDLGALVRETFAADREKVRALVEAQVKALKAQATTGEHTAPTLSDRTPTPKRDQSEPRESTMKAAATASGPLAVPPPPASRGRVFVIAGVAVAAAVAAISLSRGGHAPAPAEPPASARAPAPAATVEVYISAEPAEARIYLDDTPLQANPFKGAMARSAMARKLRVSAPGFAADERLITLDRDVRLELSLRAAPAASAAASASAAPAATAAARVPLLPGPGQAPAGGPAKTASPTPGEALSPQPTKKTTRSIDDTF
jgi:serine/threonine-protein kinase